jgi:hypothetical protein
MKYNVYENFRYLSLHEMNLSSLCAPVKDCRDLPDIILLPGTAPDLKLAAASRFEFKRF